MFFPLLMCQEIVADICRVLGFHEIAKVFLKKTETLKAFKFVFVGEKQLLFDII